jgi:hypothetical protein
MVSSISSVTTLAVPTRAPANDPVAAKQIAGADRAMNLLLNDSGLLQSLQDNSNIYVPPGYNQILSLLWGVMNSNGDSNITRTELEHAVRVEGGATSDADALWSQLEPGDPNGTNPASGVTAGEFAENEYVGQVLIHNLDAERDTVNTARLLSQAQAAVNNSILLYMFGGGSVGGNLNILT